MKKTIRWAAPLLTVAILAILAAATLGAQAPAGLVARSAGAVPVSVAIGAASAATENAFEDGFRLSQPVVRVGQDYTLRAGEAAGGVRSVFGDLAVEGRVDRDAVVVLGNARVAANAVVDGSLVVIGGNATIEPGAQISRDLVVVGGSLVAPRDFSPGGAYVVVGSPVLGDTVKAFVPWLTRGLLWGRLIVPDLGWVWLIVGLALAVYLVVNALFHGPVGMAADAVQARPLSVFLLGLLVFLLTVPAIAILAATVIGIAIVPFVLCGLFVAGLVGKAGVARAIGRALVGRTSSPESRFQSLGSFLLGAVLLVLSYLVPVLGIVTWSLTTVLAMGAAAVMLRGSLRREHPARERHAPRQATEPPVLAVEEGDGRPVEDFPLPEPQTDAVALPTEGEMGPTPRAAFLDRIAAFALDCVLVGLVVLVLDLSRYDGAYPLLLISYHVAFWAWKGTTLGGIVVGLRVIRVRGAELRFVDALVRGLSGLFSLAALGIGCFWMLQDPQRQMWHDKIAGTLVVKVPRELLLP